MRARSGAKATCGEQSLGVQGVRWPTLAPLPALDPGPPGNDRSSSRRQASWVPFCLSSYL